MWLSLFAASVMLNLGQILFGRFEQGMPASRRIRKLTLFLGLTAACAHRWGAPAALAWVAIAGAAGLAFHAWWTRRHGIEFWRPEPYARYCELRGWKVAP
jgi:hypothetical protein